MSKTEFSGAIPPPFIYTRHTTPRSRDKCHDLR